MRARSHTFALAPLLVLAISGVAFAQGCGPTRLKVSETVSLDLPPAKAWALVGNFQDISWDRDAVAATGTGGNTPETAKRVVTLKGGAHFGESLYKYDAEAMSYAYHVDTIDVARLPVQNMSATLEVVPGEGEMKSAVLLKAAFYRYLRPDEGAPDAADARAVAAVKAYLRDALEGLRTKADAKT